MTRTILSIAPGALGAVTASRASTATYLDENGVLQTAAANVVRDAHYEQGVRTILLEGAGTNLWKATEDLTNAAWHKATGVTISANATAAPDGNVTADKCVQPTTAVDNFVFQQQDLTSGQPYTWSFFAKAAGYSWLLAQVELSAGSARVYFDVTNGVVGQTTSGATSGLSARVTALGSGWYRCALTFTPTATQTAVPCTVRMRRSNGETAAFAGDGMSGAYLWGADFRANGLLTSYFPNASGSASATSSPDLIGWTIPDAPHAMEWIVEFVERGIVAVPTRGVVYLGADSPTAARFQIATTTSSRYQCAHNNGVVTVASAIPSNAAPVIGQTVRLRAVLYADGSCELFQSVAGGPEISGGRSAANALAAAWSGQTFRLNSLGDGFQGNAAYISATLTDLSIHHPSISFTDAQGTVTITGLGLTLNNWVPDAEDFPPAVTAVGTGVQHRPVILRTDYTASFELPNISPAQFGDLLRLKRWLTSGGTITVSTADNQLRSYTCTLAPGTSPSWTFDDRRLLEYTVHLAVKNSAAAPMLCDYSPT